MYLTQDPLVQHPEKVSIGEHRAAGWRRMVTMPLWISLSLLLIVATVMSLMAWGEFVMMRMVVDELLPSVVVGQRITVALAVTLAYLIVWTSVGSCVARASSVIHGVSVPGENVPRKAALRHFGLVGAIAAVFGIAVMVGAAYSRADALATSLAREARTAAVLDDPQVTETELAAAASSAYDDAFLRDLGWTLLTLGVLAVGSLLCGLAAHTLAKAVGIGIVEFRIGWARRRADKAKAEQSKAEDDVTALRAAKERRKEGARKAAETLSERYLAHGPAHARVYLAGRKGNPEFTDYLIPAPGSER
ncbi:MAG: hypothetical protein WAV90_07665 [Gordonia amarae]